VAHSPRHAGETVVGGGSGKCESRFHCSGRC
jgi:hypothetical protein